MKYVNQFLYIINMLFLFSLALSYLSPYISPNTFLWPLAFLGLLYPFLIGVNIIFSIYWIIMFKRYFWSNLLIILIGWNQISSSVSYNQDDGEKSEFNIMSFNVRLFNAYEWIKKPNIKNDIINFINSEKPDILCLQEFYAPNKLPNINLKHNHIGLQTKKKEWRMATYSNFPIIKKGTVSIHGEQKNNVCIYSDIIHKKDTIRIYNIHLASNWFTSKDYLFLEKPTVVSSEFKKGVTSIFNRLKTSFTKRSEQVEIIKKHINQSPYRVIICGDFNDTPNSYAYKQLSSNLKDCFLEKGYGFGKTYNRTLPSFRIDYILTSPEIKITNFKTEPVQLSDHYPITAGVN